MISPRATTLAIFVSLAAGAIGTAWAQPAAVAQHATRPTLVPRRAVKRT